MKSLLKKLIQGLAYLSAALVIILAIGVGMFRLMLPRLPEYQEEIKTWASAAIGVDVEFTGMNARWRLSGPELSFFGAALRNKTTGVSLLTADEVSIGVGLMRLVADRELVVDRISVRDSAVDLVMNADGEWMVQGVPVQRILADRAALSQAGGEIKMVGTNIAVNYEHPSSGQLVPFTIRTVSAFRDSEELGVEAVIDLPDILGNRLEVAANRRLGEETRDVWRIFVEANDIELAGLSRLQPFDLPQVASGTARSAIWFDVANGSVTNATANVDIRRLRAAEEALMAPIDVEGNIEFSAAPDGWLLGANQLQVTTAEHQWPESSLQLSVQKDAEGAIDSLRASASWFSLDDLKYLRAWLPAGRQAKLDELAPSGVMRDVDLELDDLQAARPQFDVSASLVSAGFAATEQRPGLRNFSGRVRADRDGGRVEIESSGLLLDLNPYLPEPFILDDALGTIIWRRNADGVTVLSDSVQIRNADLDSQMSLEVQVPSDGTSPLVDYESTWAVFDVAAVDRYLPARLMQPKLYQWLSDALVSGHVARGTTRFTGPLRNFPFDDGSGLFRIEARLEDATLRFSPKWPAPDFRHLDIVVENMRLYSVENSATNIGNVVEDASLEIADLREPVLHIEAFADGTLQSIRDYVRQSPIAEVFGGHLDQVEVDGDASFDLSLTLPIQNAQDYEFMTRIRSEGGTVRALAFPAPVSDLRGTVTVTRDQISSESLVGRFLGNPVDLSLRRLEDGAAPHAVILEGTGVTTPAALQSEFEVPLDSIIEGSMPYRATVRFPNANAPAPGKLEIGVTSDLVGLRLALPEPLRKPAAVKWPLQIELGFPSPDEIATTGRLAGDIVWTAAFIRTESGWDFDRGVLALGEEPRQADVRGLHIHGQVAKLDLHDWLAEGRRATGDAGIVERIRSMNLDIGRFYAIGQEFIDHTVEVNRSGQDWFIEISGDQAQGLVTVPYDFSVGRPLALDMQRLWLPGNETADTPDDGRRIDPRTLPAVSVRAADFALGERHFGTLNADFDKSNRGLEASSLSTTDETFTIEGSAGWVIDAYEETGQRTYLDLLLKSSHAATTLQRLDYDPGVSSDSMQIDINVAWPGGPRKDFLAELNGDVSVSLGEGSLDEVDPGAGRVFGLLSLGALPRRLSLDFSDVFEKGFGFDSITGDFRLVDGDAFTCNLTLTGPAADVGIVGRTGLLTRDYDQAAIVSANVGSTLPMVGFFAGGPQVAAALLLFSQIFKKPLKDMGQVFYSVAGSWEEPVIDLADSEFFAAVTSRAGCLDQE